MTVTIDVGAAFPGVTESEAAMRETLAELSRNDALFFCARAMPWCRVSAVRLDRQRASLAMLSVPEEVAPIDAFIRRSGMQPPPAVLFRGQLLELTRSRR